MGHFIVRGLFTRVKSPTNFKKALAFLAHLVPCFWIGWWLWRAGCISQDTYILYGIDPLCRIFLSNPSLKRFVFSKDEDLAPKCWIAPTAGLVSRN